MDKKSESDEMICCDRRNFVMNTGLCGAFIALAASLGVVQSSCAQAARKSPVPSRPAREEHIAACGLFCSNCPKFKSGKCQGCQIEPGYKCEVRDCVFEKDITGCWDCDEFKAPASFKDCKKINTFMGKIWKLVYKSDRPAALTMIRDQGKEAFIKSKLESGRM